MAELQVIVIATAVFCFFRLLDDDRPRFVSSTSFGSFLAEIHHGDFVSDD